jgi:hypothetical protein
MAERLCSFIAAADSGGKQIGRGWCTTHKHYEDEPVPGPSKPPRDEHDQPLPQTNGHPVVQELVLADLQERLAIGIQRYGTGLQPHNGRDMLRDAYDEAMDLTVYLRGCLYERDGR